MVNVNSDNDTGFEELLESALSYNFSPPERGEIRTATILQIHRVKLLWIWAASETELSRRRT